jgi:protein phosphatase
MLNILFGQASDPGKLRPNNEDAMGVFIPKSRQEAQSHGWMFVVADGVGGLNFGDIASAKTVAVMLEEFAQAPPDTSLVALMPRLIQFANAAVHDEGLQPARRGKRMATTVVCCALRHDQAIISHVGDSRCYHVRRGKVIAVTCDHTLVTEQHRLGLISKAEAEHSENRHILTRSLGPDRFITAETATLTLKQGDTLMLCSDGLYGAMYDENIARICSQKKDAQQIADELVRHAVDEDGSDNVTAQVISILSVEQMSMYRGRPYRSQGV